MGMRKQEGHKEQGPHGHRHCFQDHTICLEALTAEEHGPLQGDT